jgi:hypothetical protein
LTNIFLPPFGFQQIYCFIFWGNDCGNGGCNDSSIFFSDASGTSTDPTQIFGHEWGWGHGGTTPYGFQGEERLAFVITYRGNMFLFSNGDSPVVVVDGNGNVLHSISKGSSTISNILNGGVGS